VAFPLREGALIPWVIDQVMPGHGALQSE